MELHSKPSSLIQPLPSRFGAVPGTTTSGKSFLVFLCFTATVTVPNISTFCPVYVLSLMGPSASSGLIFPDHSFWKSDSFITVTPQPVSTFKLGFLVINCQCHGERCNFWDNSVSYALHHK